MRDSIIDTKRKAVKSGKKPMSSLAELVGRHAIVKEQQAREKRRGGKTAALSAIPNNILTRSRIGEFGSQGRRAEPALTGLSAAATPRNGGQD